MQRGGKGQAFSMDLVIGVLIFMLALGIIYSLLAKGTGDESATLRIESEVIAERLTSSSGIAQQNQLQMEGLAAVAQSAEIDYDALREQLGVQGEFCIYLTDENGNLVYIQDPATNKKYPGVGSSNGDITLTQWDIPCGKACDSGECI